MNRIRNLPKVALLALVLAMCAQIPLVSADLEGKRPKPEGWFYGLGLGYTESIYIDKDNRFIPLPSIGYIGEKITFAGPFFSYKWFDQEGFSSDLKLRVRFDGYSADDSYIFEGMAKREMSLDGGFGVAYQKKDIARFELTMLHDTLGRHKGMGSGFQISRQFNKGPFFFVPEIAVQRFDENFVDYYYGVEQDEAKAFRPYYEGKAVTNYRADFNISTPIFFGGFTRLDLGYIWYGNEIANSPLVDKDQGFNIRFAFTRFF
jgi:MipA family protein